jgi:hypothetical protein
MARTKSQFLQPMRKVLARLLRLTSRWLVVNRDGYPGD